MKPALRATARLQLHKGFTLDDAAAVVPYLAGMGISHVYTSPILTARPGSMHGYDIVDHRAINPELGGEPALRRLVAELRTRDMGIIVDIVPNHMGVGGNDNAWWLDVLEWGLASPYASFFDIDWAPPDATLHNRIQVPFLGASYGNCLDAGEIRLDFATSTGKLSAVYGEHVFPIAPQLYRLVFGDLVANSATSLASQNGRAAIRKAASDMQRQLVAALHGDPADIEARLQRFSAETDEGRRNLHRLLERQHYRLVWWRAAADEINWRRFFDVTSLAGLRAELPAVFDASHELILRLYAEGLIDGLRIDHIDGLADPRAYCRKLRRSLETAQAQRPADAPPGDNIIVVEKILAPHERLPGDWLTDGTTGYDFMDQVSAVLHDPQGEAGLTDLWQELTGNMQPYEAEERDARRLILRDALASELNGTAAAMLRVARRDLATRDYTLTAIRRALVEILVHFPVYRLYAGLAGRAATDDHIVARAIAGARRTMRAADHPLLDQIDNWLGGHAARALPPGPARRERLRAIVRFEQLSSPVAAKSMEDTAFYRYGRLLSRNEVGSNPGQFALAPKAFHAACAARARHFPQALLATATHDHKRGEDVRARLAVLSEIPDEWAALLRRWTRLNAPLRRHLDHTHAPDVTDEVMLYQMLVGAWPPGLQVQDIAGVAEFGERIARWQEKALREAKRHTAWVAPDESYETACRDFLFALLAPARAANVAAEIAEFARRIGPAGAVNGLSQTLLRLTTPGVPDLYQGADRWDMSLVDPDNRQPVDYGLREGFLRQLNTGLSIPQLVDSWHSGEVKQALIARALRFRQQMPALFAEGKYLPLRLTGPEADHVMAFARQHGGARAIVAVTRLPAKVLQHTETPLVPASAWHGTRLHLPGGWGTRTGTNILTGEQISVGASMGVAMVFNELPAALVSIA